MRPLRQYINEIGNLCTLHSFIMEQDLSNTVVHDLKVIYNGPDNLYIEVPENYSESDIQIYMDDTLLTKLPANDNLSEKFFGKNKDKIADVYFEYDSIDEAMGKDQTPDIEWDSRYDSKDSDEENKLHIMCIHSIKYIILFDDFELIEVKEDDIKSELIKIFTNTNSSTINNYPFELIFDSKNIEYKE